MRILGIVWISSVRLDSSSVLCLIDGDLSVLVGILRKIHGGTVSDGDCLTFPHRSESIVKTVCRSVVDVRAAVAAHLHIIVKDERISGDHVFDIDLCDISGRIHSDRICKFARFLIKRTILCHIRLPRLRLIKYYVPLNILREMDFIL